MLYRISAVWARVELYAAAFLALCVTLLILLNVLTRNIGQALFWVDELAIYSMIWMTFLGASASLHYRNSIAVTLLSEAVTPRVKRIIIKTVDMIVLSFALALLGICWRWYLPWDIAKAGFDVLAFQGNTFNFIYAEPTLTLGLPKYLFWLAMWLFAIGATLHSVMHVLNNAPPEELE